MDLDVDEVARICFKFYENKLLVKAKPAKNEWTTLASIVCQDASGYKIISMATGSKCLAEKQLPLNGGLVHDSHAEVLARRCFVKYIMNEIRKLADDSGYKSDIVEKCDNSSRQFSIKPNLKFILFTSHTPCGDASIMPKSSSDLKRANDGDDDDDDDDSVGHVLTKKIKLDEQPDDIHRTGAKCVPTSEAQDPKEKGVLYHVTGVLRTKPGRGDPTISMSCSDKIAKWLVLGMQGSLLSVFLKEPIYLHAIVVSACPFNVDSMKRALIDRSKAIVNLPANYRLAEPIIKQSSLVFKDSKIAKNVADELKACPNSVCWIQDNDTKPLFVLVKGNLQGARKDQINLKNSPPICQYKYLELFKQIYSKLIDQNESFQMNYSESKQLAVDYNTAGEQFYKIYSNWLRTDRSKFYSFKLQSF